MATYFLQYIRFYNFDFKMKLRKLKFTRQILHILGPDLESLAKLTNDQADNVDGINAEFSNKLIITTYFSAKESRLYCEK